MSSLVYSAIGAANIRGSQYKLDLKSLDPGMLMVSNDPSPTDSQAADDAKTPLAQQLRASMLQTMGLNEGSLSQMKPQTRADLETQMAREIHEQILSTGSAAPNGSFVDMKAWALTNPIIPTFARMIGEGAPRPPPRSCRPGSSGCGRRAWSRRGPRRRVR